MRQIALNDGSKITLNTDSAIAVHYTTHMREIALLQGEAFFEVAKDAQHPFIVNAQAAQVRAVGTAFSVLTQSHQTQVDLLEGIVEVTHGEQKLRLSAGQRVLINDKHQTLNKENKAVESMALWREGYLQIDSLSLQEAVVQINRYFSGKVILINSQLADKKVSGVFGINTLNQAVASFSTAVPGLRVVYVTPYFILLR